MCIRFLKCSNFTNHQGEPIVDFEQPATNLNSWWYVQTNDEPKLCHFDGSEGICVDATSTATHGGTSARINLDNQGFLAVEIYGYVAGKVNITAELSND